MKKILLMLVIILSGHIAVADIMPGKTYKIYLAPEGKVITTKNSSLNSGTEVVVWTETGVNAQRWTIYDAGSGEYQLQNAYSYKILYRLGSAVAGAKIVQNDQNNNANGKWVIEPVAGQDYSYIRQGGLYLTMPANIDGSQLELQSTSSSNSRWILEEVTPEPNYLTPAIRDEMMQSWKDKYVHPAFGGNLVLGNTKGWWGDAEMIEIILDAYETTGDDAYLTMFNQLYANFVSRNGNNWMGNDYNDDITWMVITSVRGYLHTKNSSYFTNAKNNFDAMYSRALFTSGQNAGMLRWKQGADYPNSTNSCINGPAEVAACYLAIATGDDSYYIKAKDLYALQRSNLYDPSSGAVWDSWDYSKSSERNYWSSTYNQGTFLGAALMLYKRYGDEQYKEDAKKIMQYTVNNLCDGNGIIKVCQTGSGDLSGFKGILMRYVRRFIEDLGMPELGYSAWMRKNAFHAYNNRNSSGVSSSAWLSKTPENFILSDCSENCDFSTDPFGPSTAVSAAVNSPVEAVFYLIGDGCPTGWNLGTSALRNAMAQTSSGVFTWTGKLTAGGGFKFLIDPSNWDPAYTCRTNIKGNLIVSSGQTYDIYLYPTPNAFDNKFQIDVTDDYKIELNLNTMTMIVTDRSAEAMSTIETRDHLSVTVLNRSVIIEADNTEVIQSAEIYDIMGKCLNFVSNIKGSTVFAENLTNGVYIVKAKINNKDIAQKVIITGSR